MRSLHYYLLALALYLVDGALFAQDRIALVVGNADYEKASVLDNTTNDASDIAAVLRQVGFDVLLHQDIRTRGEFREAVRHWREALAYGKDSVGLFFYAGHAVQVNGENYLIPTAADLRDIPDLDIETLSLGYVTAMAGDAGNPVNLFFVDACRDNPFRGFSRSLNRGLAVTDTPEGSIIVYAASPGKVASDGSGRNSPFTANLLREITSSEHVLLMLQNVVKGVRQDTGGQQQPWFHASLTGDFYFNSPVQEPRTSVRIQQIRESNPGGGDQSAESQPAQSGSAAAGNSVSMQSTATGIETAGQGVSATQVVTSDHSSRAGSGVQQHLAKAAPADQRGLSGAWTGDFFYEGKPGASVTLRLRPTGDGGYDVGFSRLINYGVLPVSCGVATGRLMSLGPTSMRLAMTHSGCRGSGTVSLDNGRLTGDIELGGRSLSIDLGPAGSG